VTSAGKTGANRRVCQDSGQVLDVVPTLQVWPEFAERSPEIADLGERRKISNISGIIHTYTIPYTYITAVIDPVLRFSLRYIPYLS
jgi:hypothetical protein